MIQILGLRQFTDTETGEVKLYDAFFRNEWRVESVSELFQNIEKHLEQIPEEHRWNLFYTVAVCTDRKREFLRQEVLPIDIDGIDEGTEDQVVDVVCRELGLPMDKVGIVYSGNGVHILIGLSTPILNPAALKEQRVYYKALCGRINLALYSAALKGKADPTVFSDKRILRLPMTENRKEGKPVKHCTMKNRTIVPLDVSVLTLADLPSVSEGEHIHPNAFARMPKPDADAVMGGCSFLQHCSTNQTEVSEPQWYAMISVVGRFEDGNKRVHEYSQRYPKYNPAATDHKLEHALESAGPRTCANISTMWEGCVTCPHFKKITSPIQIVNDNTIRSKENGFYNIVIKDGEVKLGKPNYDDLVKYFSKQNDYLTIANTREVYLWRKTHWEATPNSYLHAFAEENFRPSPTNNMCSEFEGKIKRTNLRDMTFLDVPNKLNFPNGVFDMDTGLLMPRTKEYGFTYVMPDPYEPKGDCPRFKQFMQEVTVGDEKLQTMLLEYLGYCISGVSPELVQKCVILYGDGSNGKSVLLKLLRALVGANNCATVNIEGLNKETNRSSMVGKMINISSETPREGFLESDVFKAMVSGDEVSVRKLYQDPFTWKCTTKLIFACNDLPLSLDASYGMRRRLLIAPFKGVFTAKKGNLDPYILDHLLAEKSDIIAYLVDNFRNLKARNYAFNEPPIVTEELDTYTELNDSVSRFVNQTCTSKEGTFLSVDFVYRCYVAWCDDLRVKPASYAAFSKRATKSVESTIPNVVAARASSGTRQRGFRNLSVNIVEGIL